MKYLLICEANRAQIEQALASVNGKKIKNVFTHYHEIDAVRKLMHKKLNDIGLNTEIGRKNEAVGSCFIVSSYRPQSHYPDKLHKVTCITLKMMEKGIVLLTEPEYLYSFMCNAYSVKNDLFITKEQEEIVLRRLHKKYKRLAGD